MLMSIKRAAFIVAISGLLCSQVMLAHAQAIGGPPLGSASASSVYTAPPAPNANLQAPATSGTI